MYGSNLYTELAVGQEQRSVETTRQQLCNNGRVRKLCSVVVLFLRAAPKIAGKLLYLAVWLNVL